MLCLQVNVGNFARKAFKIEKSRPGVDAPERDRVLINFAESNQHPHFTILFVWWKEVFFMAKKKKRAGIVAHQLPSGSYRVQLYIGKDESGKRIYKSFTDPDPDAAIMAARDYKENKDKPESITLEKAVEQYISNCENIISPSTLHGYRSIQKIHIPQIGSWDVHEITSADLQGYVNSLSAKLSPKTVSNIYGLISSALKQANVDKIFRVQLPKKKKVFRDLPEPEQVIAAIMGTDIELPVLLAVWLSLRMSEVRGIKYKDIKGNVLTIQRSRLTVNGVSVERDANKTYESTRKIEIPKYLKDKIGKGDPDEYVVKMSAMQIYTRLKKYLAAAGIQPIRFHDLRHMFASVMHKLGVPDKYVMEEGGWSTDYVLKNNYQHTLSDAKKRCDPEKGQVLFGRMQHEMQHDTIRERIKSMFLVGSTPIIRSNHEKPA